jgi:hypothetical protein
MKDLIVFNDVLPDPHGYREIALASDFKDFKFNEDETYCGIGLAGHLLALPKWITAKFPQLTPKVSFFRKSPVGQIEPAYIHADYSMGDWTAILYLNENPPDGDGTTFWKHKDRGFTEVGEGFDGSADFNDQSKWERWCHVAGLFNRAVLFRAPLFHSRGIFENYGNGHQARLIQVVFGTGSLS